MQKMVCIPVERYEAMIRAYDEAIAELEEMKSILAGRTDSKKRRRYGVQGDAH